MDLRIRHTRRGFTLVELLIVIAIIGILASLIGAAANMALKKAKATRIKTEVDQIAMALETYKDTYGSYPPNGQTDDLVVNTNAEPAEEPISELTALNDFKTHLRQAFPQNREDENLLRAILGLAPLPGSPTVGNFNIQLDGGMTAGEALVFWLGGFSPDPQYPITGEGGPAYRIDNLEGGVDPNQADAIESRKMVYPFEVARLGPRGSDGYFLATNDAGGRRFIEFVGTDGNDYRINFWQYTPPRSTQPFLYFDTSRHPAGVRDGSQVLATYDPPAATELTGLGPEGTGLHVHAIKRRSASLNSDVPIQFATPDKYQVMHAGIDDDWGVDAFERMSAHEVNSIDPADYLLSPDGPFTGAVGDTIVNFSEGTLEASQP